VNSLALIRASLRFYRRTNLGVVLGAAVATSVLVGALVVGDSVRHTLRRMALQRIGEVDVAMAPGTRFFRDELAGELAEDMEATAAAVLQLRGSVTAAGTEGGAEARADAVSVLGVTEAFRRLGGAEPLAIGEDSCVLNRALASRLNVAAGDEIVIRVERPSVMSRAAPLASSADASASLRLRVAAVAGAEFFGDFSLRVNQLPPLNAFVPLARLQRAAKLDGRANLLLVGGAGGARVTVDSARDALNRRWTLDDAEAELRTLPKAGPALVVELRSRRVFLDAPLAEAAAKAGVPAMGIFSYLANEIRTGEKAIPYSMVTALGDPREPKPGKREPNAVRRGWSLDALGGDPIWSLVPPEMGDDEIIISEWLAARDLDVAPGETIDRVELSYYVITESGQLREVSPEAPQAGNPVAFAMRGRPRPMDEGPAAELMRELMPKFPWLPEDPTLDDLELASYIDSKVIDKYREKLDAYWNRYRGTPKAFVTLEAAKKMWKNEFGELTAVRFPPGSRERVEGAISEHVDPASMGLYFLPVRQRAMRAGAESQDFGMLFLGFSFFLIAAAVLLTALLFSLGVEQRSGEVGMLLAVGYRPAKVRRLLLAEGAVLAAAGGLLGVGGGMAYTWATLHALATVWRKAVIDSPIGFHAEWSSLVIGASAGVVSALAAVWLSLRWKVRRTARELLAEAGTEGPAGKSSRGRAAAVVAIASAAGGAALMLVAGFGRDTDAAMAFFGAGALLLISVLGASAALLAWFSRRSRAGRAALGEMAIRNAARRRRRSLAVVALLACGSFLVVSVGANRYGLRTPAGSRASGTGGFALYGESTLPVLFDLNTAEGRREYALNEQALGGVSFVPMRLLEGDDATCMNLNRARQPRLLGADPEMLRRRGAFRLTGALDGLASGPWVLLEEPQGEGRAPDGPVPGVADEETITYALGKELGDVVEYTDERGRAFKVRLVGSLAGSVLQGNVVISQRHFLEHFPSREGHRVFLIDAPPQRASAARAELARALSDLGFSAMPASERLAAFNTVKNTYISIFQALGGLGLLLGCAGMAVVVLRNVMERRGELALLRAVGFRRGALVRLVLWEHFALLALGLGGGVLAAVVAVLPALLSPGVSAPYGSLALTLAAVAAVGAAFTWLASAMATRGPILPALRNE